MRTIDLSGLNSAVSMPLKSGSIEFMQLATKDVILAMVQNIIGNSDIDPAIPYIISGCRNQGTAPNYNITDGWVYWNNELLQFDGAIFTCAAGEVPALDIDNVSYTINADPVKFSDDTIHNIHINNKLIIFSDAVGGTEYSDMIDVSNYNTGWGDLDLNSSLAGTTGFYKCIRRGYVVNININFSCVDNTLPYWFKLLPDIPPPEHDIEIRYPDADGGKIVTIQTNGEISVTSDGSFNELCKINVTYII